jgi:hypothetical protein
MAVDDLEVLRSELPEVFSDRHIPDAWDDEWVLVPLENSEAATVEDLPWEEILSEYPDGLIPTGLTTPNFGVGWPGGPVPWPPHAPTPPADCTAAECFAIQRRPLLARP